MVVMANSLRQNSTSERGHERGHGAATNGAKELAQGHVSEVSGQDLLWQGPACVRPRGMQMKSLLPCRRGFGTGACTMLRSLTRAVNFDVRWLGRLVALVGPPSKSSAFS